MSAEPLPTPLNNSRQRRKDARPQELLDAALALFVERGFANTRIEEVALSAGVSKGTLYLYYPSKEELLKAVIRHFLGDEIAAGAAEAAAHPGTASEALATVFVRWWQRVFDSPASGVFKLVFTEVRSFPDIGAFYAHEVVEPGRQAIGDIVRRGIASGEFGPADIDNAVHSLLLPMVMLCLHKHSVGACLPLDAKLDAAGFIADHMALVARGLARRPAP